MHTQMLKQERGREEGKSVHFSISAQIFILCWADKAKSCCRQLAPDVSWRRIESQKRNKIEHKGKVNADRLLINGSNKPLGVAQKLQSPLNTIDGRR